MSYSGYQAFGAEPSPENGGTATPGLPEDVAPSAVQQIVDPIARRRGWVAVPTYDVRQYVQQQFIVAAIGFGFGVTVGAVLGDILGGRRVAPVTKILGANPKGKRRTTARKRKRGRPTVRAVSHEELRVKMPDGYADVVIHNGEVRAGGMRVGTVYDTGTRFRSVPMVYDAPVREFTTLAGAVKHLIRTRERAA